MSKLKVFSQSNKSDKERKLKMKTKYAGLIAQLERVTEAYERALEAVKALEAATGEQPDILGVSGGVEYFGDYFEKKRAIHIDQHVFTLAALDCGHDFSCEAPWEKDYIRFCCTIFGYRVFCIVVKWSEEEACLMNLLAAEEKSNE